MVLTAYIKFEMNSQAMIERVGMLRARQCHGRGTRTSRAANMAPAGSSICIEGERRWGKGSGRPYVAQAPIKTHYSLCSGQRTMCHIVTMHHFSPFMDVTPDLYREQGQIVVPQLDELNTPLISILEKTMELSGFPSCHNCG